MARFSKEKSQDNPLVGRLVKLTIDISSNNGDVVVFLCPPLLGGSVARLTDS